METISISEPGPDIEIILIRTDFSDGDAWGNLLSEIDEYAGDDGFILRCINKPENEGKTATDLLKGFATPDEHGPGFFVIADRAALEKSDFPLLFVDLFDTVGQTFRAPPDELDSIAANLFIGNIFFSELKEGYDAWIEDY